MVILRWLLPPKLLCGGMDWWSGSHQPSTNHHVKLMLNTSHLTSKLVSWNLGLGLMMGFRWVFNEQPECVQKPEVLFVCVYTKRFSSYLLLSSTLSCIPECVFVSLVFYIFTFFAFFFLQTTSQLLILMTKNIPSKLWIYFLWKQKFIFFAFAHFTQPEHEACDLKLNNIRIDGSWNRWERIKVTVDVHLLEN